MVESLEFRALLSGNTISDSGGYEGSNQTLNLGGKGGATLSYSYEHYTIPDNFIIRYEGSNLLETGFVGGSRSGKISVPKGNSDAVQIIVATNDQGTAWDYTVSAEACPDTAPFIIELAGGDFTHETDANGEAVCKGTGTVYVGRTDGIARMIRVDNATVSFDKKEMTISGTVHSLIGAGEVLSKPLFTGSFVMPFETGTSSSFSETPGGASEYQLGGMDVDFSTISLNTDSISLGASFEVVEKLGLPDYVFSGSDGLIITQSDVAIGPSIKFSAPTFTNFTLFGFVPIEEFSNFSIEYIAPQDTIKIQGKLVVDLKSKFKVGKVTADLSGENYVQIKGGEPDLKGELTVETDLKFPPKGWGLKELKLMVDTIKRDVGGEAKLELPFGSTIDVAGQIGFKLPIPPLELNKLGLSVDKLNKPVPIPSFPGVFFQGFRGAVENFAESDTDPIEFSGGLSATLGPLFSFGLSIPLLDVSFSVDNLALIRADVDGKLSSEMASGTAQVTLLHERIARSSGTVTLDWNKGFFENKGTFSFLDGLIQTNDAFKVTSSFNVNMGGVAKVSIPKAIPLVGGAEIASGSYLFDFSNDGNLSNDSVAGWGTITIRKLGLELSFVAGFRVYFDGRVERIGAKNIPLIGSWDIKPNTEWVMLGADWENPAAGAVPVRVRKPDGTWIEEADFAANNIAVVDELSDTQTKVVMLLNPEPGIWDLEVVDPTGLGTVTYNAADDAAAPVVMITTPTTTVPGGLVNIGYTAVDPDSGAEVQLYYDTDNTGTDGVLIARGLAEADGDGNFVWNTQGVAAGNYYVYAQITDGDNPPVYSYSTGTVQVTETSDLAAAVSVAPVPVLTGGQATTTFTVTNAGPSSALDVSARAQMGPSLLGSGATYAIALNAGDSIVLETETPTAGLDPALELSGPGGAVLASDANGSTDGRNARIEYSATQAGVYLVRVSPEDNTSGEYLLNLVISVGTLQGGTVRSFTVQRDAPATPGTLSDRLEVSSSTYDPSTIDNVVSQITLVDAPAVLRPNLKVTASPSSTGTLRQNFSYVITVTNEGAGAAADVVITEFLPRSYADYVGSQPSRGSSSYNGSQQAVVANLGTLDAGETATLTITLFPFAAGNLVSTTKVSGDDQETRISDNYLTTVNQISAAAPTPADLELTMTVDDDTPDIDAEVTIQLRLINKGPGVASGIRVQSLLPAGLQFNSASPEQGTYDSTTGVWDVGNIRDNVARTLTISAKMLTGRSIRLAAEVTGVAEPDPDSAPDNHLLTDDDMAALTLIGKDAAPDLAVTVEAPSQALAGEAFTYTVSVTNGGDAQAADVVLSGPLPAGLTLVSTATSQGAATHADGTVTAAFGTLAPGGTATLTLVVLPTAAGLLAPSFVAATAAGEVATDNNTASAQTTVISQLPDDVIGPQVVQLQRFGFHLAPTRLILTFDELLDPIAAADLANYQLVNVGRDGRAGTRDDRMIRIAKASYDAATMRVVISPSHLLRLSGTYRLVVSGAASGVKDVAGNVLDGDRDGSPGGDQRLVVKRSSLGGKWHVAQARAATRPRTPAPAPSTAVNLPRPRGSAADRSTAVALPRAWATFRGPRAR